MLRFNSVSSVIQKICRRRNVLLGGFVTANLLTYKSFCDEDANRFKPDGNGVNETETLHKSIFIESSISSSEAGEDDAVCDSHQETEIIVAVTLTSNSTLINYIWDRISWLSHLFGRSLRLLYIYTPVLLTSFMALSEDERIRNMW